MTHSRSRCWTAAVSLVATVLVGCGSPASPYPPRTETGAEQVAKTFFEAIMNEEWATAYATLDAESQSWCSRDRFATLGKEYRGLIGFVPTDVSISVTESGDNASAVALYRESSGPERRSYKDGTSLKHTPSGWTVILRKNFGKKAASAPSPQGAKSR